jgi:hypothetical protein
MGKWMNPPAFGGALHPPQPLTKRDRDNALALAGAHVVHRQMTERVAQLEAVLHDCVARMDQARDILTDGKPTPQCHWGMLDTNSARAVLAAQEQPK